MSVVAKASNTVRNKNAIIVLMCTIFLAMFGYDGFIGYPARNDNFVQVMRGMIEQNRLTSELKPKLDAWKTWNEMDENARTDMTRYAKDVAKIEGWKSETDISVQKYITLG